MFHESSGPSWPALALRSAGPSVNVASAPAPLSTVALAAQALCWGWAVAVALQSQPVHAQAVHASASPAAEAPGPAKSYSIGSGPLATVLSRFAVEAGIALSFDPELLRDQHSRGIQGTYTVQEGLSHLLQGTHLVPEARGQRAFVLAKRTPAQAQVQSLPAVKVVDAMEPGALNPSTDGSGSYVVKAVTIGKVPLALRDIPQSVSVVTRQQLDDQNLDTVDQALRQVTGVTTNLYGDTTAGFMARGYTLETQYDGVPASAGLQMTPQFDLAMYDRIEVLRGPSGLYQGAGTPSGSVNFVRKRPTKEFGGSASVSVGRFDRYQLGADVGGALNESGSVRGRLVASTQDKGSPNKVQRNEQTMVYAALDADLTSSTTLSLSGSRQEKDVQRFMGIPTLTSTGQPMASTPSTFVGADGGHSSYPMQEVLAELSHQFGDTGWKAHAAVRRKNVTSDLLYGYVSSGVSDANLSSVLLSRTYYEESSNGADLSFSGPFSLFGRQHSAVFGYNRDHYLYEGGSATQTLTNLPLSNTSYNLDGVPAITTNRARSLKQSGAYGSVRFQLSDPVTLILGARVSDYAYETRTLTPTPTAWTRWERANGKVTPNAGLVWQLSAEHSAYVSYADNFMPQDAFDKNGRLPAKVGWQVETGVKSAWWGGKLNTTAALFRIREKNRAIADTVNTGCDGAGFTCYSAAGLVQSQGIELEAVGRLAPGWDVSAGYTYNANEYLRDATASNIGKRFATTTPRHMFKLWSNYRLGGEWQRWTVGGGLQAQSETTQALTSSTLRQGSYAVVGLQAGYRVADATTLTLTVNNLFDRRYYERLGNRWGYTYWGDPRTLTVTLRTLF